MNKAALRAVAKLARIDLVVAIKSKRHNPILDREIHIEEELINLKESVDSYIAAGDTLRQYPNIYAHISREKRAIMKHCIGLVVRMMHGKQLPGPYTKRDIDDAVRRLVQVVVFETQRAGRRIDDDLMQIFRPYLTIRQRVALHDFGMDLVMHATQLRRAGEIASKLPLLRSK